MNESGTATSADGTELNWERSGSGPALLMIDPILVDRSVSPIKALADHFTDRFTVCRFDRRGKGESSDAGNFAPEREVDDIRAVIDSAHLGPRPVVFGFSSGGSLALLAAELGVEMSSLIVLEPPVDLPSPTSILSELRELIDEGRNSDAVLRMYRHQGMPEEIIEQMTPFAHALAGNAHTMSYDLSIIDLLDVNALSRIDVRTLAVASSTSPPQLREFVSKIADHGRAATALELDGDWHGVPDDVLAEAIVDFASADV